MYATHVKDRAPVLSNAASDVLDHSDLISYPPDIVVGLLSIRLLRVSSYRTSLRFLPRMAHEDAVR